MTSATEEAASGRALLSQATTFAELIRLRMGEQPQYVAAEQIGVSQSRISRWLSGGAPVKSEKLDAVAVWLDVTRPELDAFLRHAHRLNPRRTAADRIGALEVALAGLHEEVRALTRALERTGVIDPSPAPRRRR